MNKANPTTATPGDLERAAQDKMIEDNLGRIKRKILVMSGKGGVGKSTVASYLSLLLSRNEKKVGLLDVDLHGPSIPRLMNIKGGLDMPREGAVRPHSLSERLSIVSLEMVLGDKDTAVIWRGPLKISAIRQFISDIDWGDLDYLVIDLPPGTGDASLSLAQSLSLTGAIIVTTPQQVALSDVVRGVKMFEQLNVPILGVVENMSYFVAPDTGKRYDIFGHGGGSKMAEEVGVDFLGEVPLEPQVRVGGDEGQPIVAAEPDSAAAQAIREVARKIAAAVSVQNLAQSPGQFQSDPSLTVLN